MIKLKAEIREEKGAKIKELRDRGIIPAVLYGPKIKNQLIKVNMKDFYKIFKEAGESSLISLEVGKTKSLVLIHEVKVNPLDGAIEHVDFYQPILTEEVEAVVPLVFEGESPAVKNLGGTLVKEIQELTVKALPQNLPHEIKVNVENLKNFQDEILIKDLNLPENVKIERAADEIIALIRPPEKMEKEVEKPVEEVTEETKEKPEKEEKAGGEVGKEEK